MPDPWWTGVIIPIIGASASLLVALVALLLAHRSGADARARAARAERHNFARTVIEHLGSVIPAGLTNVDLDMIARDAQLLTPPAADVAGWIRQSFEDLHELSPEGWLDLNWSGFRDWRVETGRRLDQWIPSGVFDFTQWDRPVPPVP